jgi:hypothetical protein
MNCTRVRKNLKACLDNELTRQEQAKIRQHLQSCDGCAREAQILSGMWDMLGDMPDIKRVPDLIPGVMHRIYEHEQKVSGAGIFGWLSRLKQSFAAAAVCAMLVGFVFGFSGIKLIAPAYVNQEVADDAVFFEVFTDQPPASFSNIFNDTIDEEGENLS